MKVFICLQALDMLTTMIALQLGGREINQLVQAFIAGFGAFWGLLILKSASVFLVAMFSQWSAFGPKAVWRMLNFIYAIVLCSNAVVLVGLWGKL